MAKSIKEAKNVMKVMVAIGVDLADMWSDWLGLDESGEVVRRERVRTTEGELRRVFGEIKPTKIAVEVGTHSAWESRLLSSLGHPVVGAKARRGGLFRKKKPNKNPIEA